MTVLGALIEYYDVTKQCIQIYYSLRTSASECQKKWPKYVAKLNPEKIF
jgi:hypothetical protein